MADVLNGAVGRSFTSMDLMAIDHEIAKMTIAGNVRRAARICIKDWRDHDIDLFIHSKDDPEKFWSANISVSVDLDFLQGLDRGDPAATAVFDAVVDQMMKNGEPGFWNKSLAEEHEQAALCPNPCGEIGLEEFEPCCLGNINLAHFGNDFYGTSEAARLMARFLVRATFADIDDPRQQEVVERNRRIGVGLLGYQEWGAAHGYRYSQIYKSDIMGAKLTVIAYQAQKAAREYAAVLGIPAPIKTTCVAPTGTISSLAGVTAGIHPIYSRFFLRRVRFASDDPLLDDHIAKGHHVEDDVYSPNTKVVSIPCRDPILDRYDGHLIEQADELSPGDMFATQAFVQKNWSDNATSYTVNITSDVSRSHLAAALQHHLRFLKGATVFPDVSRPQSPYERIDKDTYELSNASEIGQALEECVTGCPVR